jgi:predicted lipoprotein with Yx(FWY)xxD motif
MVKRLGAAALAVVALAACGGGGGGYGGPAPMPTVMPATSPLSTAMLSGGPGFIDSVNHTVYVFDGDRNTPNASACSDACAQYWPPITVAPGAALPPPWTSFVRSDGSTQLAYKTRALYASAFDASPGQTSGDGVSAFGGNWHIARP